MWSGIKTRFNLNKYSFLLIGISVFILLAASLFTAQYIYSSPFIRTSASSIYEYRLNNIQKNEGSVLGIMGKKNETGFENLMFGNRKSGMAGFYLSDKNGVEMKLEVDKKIQNREVMPVTSKGKDGKAIVTYKDIAKDTDLIYKTTTSQIKEEIIINTREAAENTESYTFNLNIQGLSYEKNEDDTVIPTFTSIKDKETTYTIPPAFMIDSKGAKSYGVITKITEDSTNPNNLIIELTPNKTWLTSDDRQFPIIIDPTLIKGNPPILSLNFDEGYGQTTQDWSTNNNDGTLGATSGAEASDPTWKSDEECISGKCLRFDGTDDYVNAGSANSLDDIGVITISAWIKPNSYGEGNYGRIVDKGLSTGATYGRGFFLCNDGGVNCNVGSISFFQNFDNTDGWWSTPANSIPLNTWTHVAVIYDRSSAANNPVIYINGKEQTVTENSSPSGNARSDASYNLYVGNRLNDDRTFLGFIDNVRIYNYARSITQIRQEYISRGSVMDVSAKFGPDKNKSLSDGLVAYYKLEESATPSTDSSGNGNSGTWVGNTAATVGKYSSGVVLDGNGDYISVADSASLDISNQITVSAWVKSSTTNPGSLDTVLAKGDSTYRIHAESVTKDAWMFDIDTSLGICRADAANGSITTNWQHLVGVFDGQSCTLYIDGAQVAKTTLTSIATISTNNYALWIGNNSQYSSRDMSGTIDEVRIYNRSLSEAEVRALYNYAPGPAAYFPLDEGTGTSTVYDISGNGLTGTMNTIAQSAWVNGRFGKGLMLDGSDDYVSILFDNAPSGTTIYPAFTISGWFKPTSTTTTFDFYSWGDTAESGSSYVIAWMDQTASNHLKFFIDGADKDTGYAITANNWYYITLAKTSSELWKVYVNGTLVYTYQDADTAANNTNSQYIFLGEGYDDPSYPGIVDDFKIYTYERTSAQITEDMNGGHPAPGSPVGSAVGHWKFDEGVDNTCSGGTNDVCNWGNAGSALDGAKFGMSVPATNTSGWTSSGKLGKGLNFDGSDDYLSMSNPNEYENTTTSVSIWVRSTTDSPQAIYSLTNSAADSDYQVMYVGNSVTANCTDELVTIVKNSSSGGGSYILCYTTSARSEVFDGNWHHLLVTFDGINTRLYLDSKERPLTTGSGIDNGNFGQGFGTINDFSIGSRITLSNRTAYYNGSLDELKIYNFALNSDQVKAEYNQGKAQVLGSLGTESDGKKPSFSASREYCVPGDTSTCNPPVAVYKLDEDTGTTANNFMGGSYTGTLTNSPTWTTGKYGKGVNFDGSNDYIVTGNSFNPTSAYSVSMWAYLRTTSTDDTFFSSSTSETGLALYIGNGTNNNLVYCNDNVCYGTSGSNNNVLTDNSWQHITFTYNGSGESRFYVNGLDVTSDNTNSETADTGNKIFGNYDTVNNFALDGVLDEIRVYDYVRTPAQIAWEYNRGAPVAWYKFDECSGTVINDWGPNSNGGFNGNTGTLTIGGYGSNTVVGTCATNPSAWYSGNDGKVGSAMSFDGTDDYVSGPFSSSTNLSSVSMFAWVKITNLPGSGERDQIFRIYNSAEDDVVASINIANDPGYVGRMQFLRYNGWVSDGKAWDCLITQSTLCNIPTSQWAHVGVVQDSSNGYVYFYRDGKQVASYSSSHTTWGAGGYDTSGGNFTIGKLSGTSSAFDGLLDDVRIFNYALTPQQVRDVYNNGAVSFK